MAKNDALFPMLEAVIATIDEGVIISDKNGDVIYSNPAALRLLNLKPTAELKKIQNIGDFNRL